MPVESKPIFRPDVIRAPVAGFRVPDAVKGRRDKLNRWAELIGSGKADQHKEQEILGDFLNDIFCELLGYQRAVDNPQRYTFSREKHVAANGKFADAVLGEFGPGRSRYVAVLEGKGPKDPLDRPFAGRKVSAVDQAYDYAINLRCNWILVTSIRQTRLYCKGLDKQTFERFDTEALAGDEKQFKKFVFLLHADRVEPPSGECHLDGLLQESEKVGRELTNTFYREYDFARRSTFNRLRVANPDLEPRLVLASAQKLLDRILFVAFCEDRGLLPSETIKRAFAHRDPYNPRPLWDNFRGMFRAINVGSEALKIPPYNGGLFADDPILDGLTIPDGVFQLFQDLAEYDFRSTAELAAEDAPEEPRLIDVEILGHIFEQSINALEELQAELSKPAEEIPTPPADISARPKVSRRKREGAFYTPAFITRYIVEQALGGVLRDRFARLRSAHAAKATKTAQRVMDDPAAYDLDALNGPQTEALLAFWEGWQEELKTLRIADCACGSGAFLIEAFDQLNIEYQKTNARVRELRGGYAELFDPDRTILRENLYGVDLNEEAVHIARLSLWIKTAAPGKPLTSLDHTLRVGNSVVDDPSVDPRAFDWRAAFPEVFGADGKSGFDVVIGNPPYIRQEWLSPIKPYLQSRYSAFHGMADLYVYFYELGLNLLKPGGRLSYVVTNKWMKAGYGEPLRRFFAERTWMESVVDFGHAKQIFEEADVFPCIIVAHKPTDGLIPTTTRVCAIPREQIRISDLSTQISVEGVEIDRANLGSLPWQLEAKSHTDLITIIREKGTPLSQYAALKPLSGIKTGFNDAFLIDTATKQSLISDDPQCAVLIKPYFRGQDIKRWHCDWNGLWMIAIKSSGDHRWPWSESGEKSEEIFKTTYPSIYAHFMKFEDQLKKRQDQGEFWWELRSCAYWSKFASQKVIYQEITWSLEWSFDTEGTLCNNTAYILPVADFWILAALNAPVSWWYAWRTAIHGKDEALRFIKDYVNDFPIPSPTPEQAEQAEKSIKKLIEIKSLNNAATRSLLDWLKVEFAIILPSKRLKTPIDFDSDSFIAEIRKLRGKKKPLSLAALRSLRDEHARTIVPAQALASEASGLELQINDLVNAAYGLTPEEVRLMWDTAPPRMPIPRPLP